MMLIRVRLRSESVEASRRFKEGCSTMKDYSKLKKQFVLIDMYDDREDFDVAAGVAIPAEGAEEFARAVEELAVERFGGASFSELLDNDLDDASMDASAKKNFEDQADRCPRGSRANHEERPVKIRKSPSG